MDIAFAFPQRMEELVHLQLADKRYEIRCSLPSCKSDYYDEWFRCSIEAAKRFVKRWIMVSTIAPIYDIKTRQLAAFWTEVLHGSIQPDAVEVTAEVLLEGVGARSALSDLAVVDDLERMSLRS